MLSALDDGVGAVTAAIRDSGQEDRTLVVFLSDNGGPTARTTSGNGPLRGFKAQTWEGGIRVPFLIRWPGHIPAGRRYDRPVIQLDVVPTVLEATGASYPAAFPGRDPLPLEGCSMLSALRGGRADGRKLYWEHLGNAAIRRDRWKLVREYGRPWELYDVEVDRAELVDEAARRPNVVSDLSAEWAAWASRVGVIPWERVQNLYLREGKGDPAG